ncbi:hypothetical protein [Gimesia fumaroli]|nr:hypothetical protein [Gimesia fumaroli]
MSKELITIPRTPDLKVIETFQGLCSQFGFPTFSIATVTGVSINDVISEIDNPESQEFNLLLEADSTVINLCQSNHRGIHIQYYRGGTADPKSPLYDEVIINWSPNNSNESNLSPSERLEIGFYLAKKLNPFDPRKIAQWNVPEQFNQAFSIHDEMLNRLEQLNVKLIEDADSFRRETETHYLEKEKTLEESIEKKAEELKQEYINRQSELTERQADLDATLAEIDARNNTVVRREIRDKMLEDVKDRFDKFGVSPSTEQKRTPVFRGILLLGIVILGLLILSLYEYHILLSRPLLAEAQKNSSPSSSENEVLNIKDKKFIIDGSVEYTWYWQIAKTSILSFALISTILYAIKWQDKWARQHSDLEFELQQFNLDVNRANWVIESCLEWRKETQSDVPEVLLNSITRNLFKSNSNKEENVIHPADELASAIIGTSSKLKLNVAGNEIELNPKKVPKEISNGNS